ncbi:MAG: Phosphoribosylanthranilate isomerase [Brockia lithotrophica]|uniref:N-(5'-phosphoribosyl)anthranilate isomerase n=1 Tax=Brockia lithotrophica TaxID=933949 RepID=A0A2T5G741_9BACL|nr:phosphoribosylanthranilate isomerase [Brockia lithotrophica]PTQ52003.1 MAG: Phosphoribosylanthranilate isomerase [Brockia lithotrophica]
MDLAATRGAPAPTIKVCGVQRVDTLLLLTDLEVEYAGFVFVPGSRRYLSPASYHELLHAYAQEVRRREALTLGLGLPSPSEEGERAAEAGSVDVVAEKGSERRRLPRRVGVFVRPSLRAIEAVLTRGPLGLIQLHGVAEAREVEDVHFAFRIPVVLAVGPEDFSLVQGVRVPLHAVLVDSPGGGTGRAFSWEVLPRWRALADALETRLWVAGGLTPENVGELLRTYRPDGVDVSSGVERGGQKDPERIRAFVRAVRGAAGD